MKIRDAIHGGPSPYDLIIELDYAQLEVYVAAVRSGCPDLIEMLIAGGDLHAETAAKKLGCAASEVPAGIRKKAKPVNFQLAYGGTAGGIAKKTGMPEAEAQAFIDGYYGRFPGVKAYQDDLLETAQRDARHYGYRDHTGKPLKEYVLQDAHGKTYVFHEEQPEWARRPGMPGPKLKNWPVQGLASDIVRCAMAEMWRCRHELFQAVKPAAQVHDSVGLRTCRAFAVERDTDEVFLPSEMEAVLQIRRIMAEYPIQRLRELGLDWPDGLPLRVDVEAGRTWGSIQLVNMGTNEYAK